ncbi:MAG TPA: hypothetical protein VGE69_14480 [Pseudomonadales bacterium]
MNSGVRILLPFLLTASIADAACISREKPSGTIVVQSCEVLDTENDPYVGVVSKRMTDERTRANFLYKFTGVIISSKDNKFFFHDLSRSACDALDTGDIIQANVMRECCDGGGGAPCGLGFDTYITEFEKAQ